MSDNTDLDFDQDEVTARGNWLKTFDPDGDLQTFLTKLQERNSRPEGWVNPVSDKEMSETNNFLSRVDLEGNDDNEGVSFIRHSIKGDLWIEPTPGFMVENKNELSASLSVDRRGGSPIMVTTSMFLCPGCKCLHVNLYIDEHTFFQMKITPDGKIAFRPGYRFVEKPNRKV